MVYKNIDYLRKRGVEGRDEGRGFPKSLVLVWYEIRRQKDFDPIFVRIFVYEVWSRPGERLARSGTETFTELNICVVNRTVRGLLKDFVNF